MEPPFSNDDLKFLAGGGEMGELIRGKDWSLTPLGKPQTWPQSLRTTLGILLNSSFPMFFWWGPELICFYNDAYRPSLGQNGKHPSILGMKGAEAWPEAWGTLKPWIDGVLQTGKSTWNEDLLVPIFRNGKIEEVYWTFSYSTVLDESGTPAGVFVACVETTGKVKSLKRIVENEQALKESAEDLRSMVLQAPIGICILDAATLVSEIVNERFVEIAGKPFEDIAGKYYWDTFAEAREYYEPAMKQVVEAGITYNADEVKLMLIRHGKEEIIYVTFVYAPLKDKEGKVKKVTVWVLENTRQVEARQKIEEAEQKTTLALNSAELGMYEIIYATDEMITDARFKEIWGVEKEASRKEYVAAIHPDDQMQRETAHKLSLATGQLDYNARVIWSDGSIHWTRITGILIYDQEKAPVKLIGIAQDINASVIAQNKIEESERDLRNIIIQAPVAMCIFRGPQYIIEIANNKMFELWGHTSAETLGKPVFEGLPEIVGHGFEELLFNVFTNGERFTGNEQPVPLLRDGKVTNVYVNFVYEAMKNGDGAISGILAVAVDVTEQVVARHQIEEVVAERTQELKVVNDSLESKNTELERMNKELESFAYISSHDLQEPLRKIQTFSSQILEKEANNLSDTGKFKFGRIQNAAIRMQTLIEDLLAYSRTSTGERKFEKVNLAEIIESVKEDLKEEIERRHAIIETNKMCDVYVIPFQFRQLIYNLISNSLKFSKSNAPPRIKINSAIGTGKTLNNEKLSADKQYCHISISDYGIGFEPQYKEKIFEVFQRLQGHEEYTGTGIGLAIVKKIVENHHGFITAESELDKGATFHIFLPVS